ncbi:hypothetical protein GCM10023115_28060 [Pontixanthobacter gangjinensis]|uniref:Universal stress protein n=1 Tax=Christiangramia aestuarii TaxID=1028746 RepID=A0A7K1LMK3_9FLAO|nr:universal stress protein [Christiangramia aestuarii]MUP42039.1 universal stress protein [Christiangramia aestuarii]
MKNILVATDFSKEAYCALHYATRLFQEKDNKFYIVNFIGDKVQPTVYSGINEMEFSKLAKLKQDSEIECLSTKHQIVRDSEFSSDNFETISSENKLLPGIKDLIKTYQIDVVVMGTRKHSGTLASIQGTNTTRVIDKGIQVPLLIIPRELEYTEPKKIAFASELIYDYNFDALQELKDIALAHRSRIILVHDGDETEVSQRQWKNYNAFKSFFGEVPVELEFYHSHYEVSRTIAKFVKEKKMDMLSMAYYRHSAAGRLFREPTVEKIDRHLSFPFLILPQA